MSKEWLISRAKALAKCQRKKCVGIYLNLFEFRDLSKHAQEQKQPGRGSKIQMHYLAKQNARTPEKYCQNAQA